MPSRVRRTLLYIPGDSARKIEKGAALDVDAVILDLEDGVASAQKVAARENVVSALREVDFGRAERLVRINAVGSGWESQDLDAVLVASPDGIVLPKTETKEQVEWIRRRALETESTSDSNSGDIPLLVTIESARAWINIREIISADERVDAILFGAEDYLADVGGVRSSSGLELLAIRSSIVAYAAAFDIQAIDMVYTHIHDTGGLLLETKQAAQIGFSGKQAIHPKQVPIIQQLFTPSDEEIATARKLVEAFEAQCDSGSGVFVYEERMIDLPAIKSAREVLEKARVAGKI